MTIAPISAGEAGASVRTKLNNIISEINGFEAVWKRYNRSGAADERIDLQNVLNTLAAAGGGKVLLPEGTIMLADTLELPNKVALIGAGKRRTVLKAATTFPTIGKPVVRLGRTVDTLAFDTYLQDLTVDCSEISASIGVTSTVIQEGSGLRSVVLLNFKDVGYRLTGNCANFHNFDLEVYNTDSASNGCIDWEVVYGTLIKATCYGNGIVGTPFGLRVQAGLVNIHGLHCEGLGDGFVVGSPDLGGTACGIDGPSHLPNVKNLVRLVNGCRMAIVGIAKNSSAHAIRHDHFDFNIDLDYVHDTSAIAGPFMIDPTTITVPATGGTYQNRTAFRQAVLIAGGTLTNVEIAKDGGFYYSCGQSRYVILLPGNYLKITYSIAPREMTAMPA